MPSSGETIPQLRIQMSTMPRWNCKEWKLVLMKLWKMTAGSGENSSGPCSSTMLLSSRRRNCPVPRQLQKPSVTTSDTSGLEPQRWGLSDFHRPLFYFFLCCYNVKNQTNKKTCGLAVRPVRFISQLSCWLGEEPWESCLASLSSFVISYTAFNS